MMGKKRRSAISYYITALAAVILALLLPMDTAGGFAAYCGMLIAAFIGAGFIPAPAIEAARAPTGDRAIDDVVRAGFAAVERMRQCAARAPEGALGGYIDRIETLAGNIFAFLRQHPAQQRMVRTFLDYTLPTTVKLLEAYVELCGRGASNADIARTLTRIQTALDNIIKSFEGTLDKLYGDRALDVDTDIDVLKGMLAREGLDNPFAGV